MSELIAETGNYGKDSNLRAMQQGDEANIRRLLLGHRIKKIADDHMELDDGTVVKIVPNRGGCSCGAGDYELADLNECDNIITAVELVVGDVGDSADPWNTYTAYEVFVVAEDKRINLFSVTGDDGNGYYGTGYELLVRYPKETP